jgi:catechol 2,3-dioxygenase-like lactoylglutathione lyase family enzyme
MFFSPEAAMRLEALKYIMLGTTDMERSVSFYRDKLGLKVLQQFEGFAFLDTGATAVVLTSDLGNRIGSGTTFASEIVFGISSVEAAFRELLALKVEFVNQPSAVNADSWAVTCKDPDGHLVTFYGAP